jgi:RNA polymerase primary sigma factor
MALMRAVDKFDCARGFKFSTYACRAILKAFSRHGMKVAKHRQRFPVEFDPALERGEGVAAVRAQSERRDADELRRIVEANEAELTDVERAVVMHRFALEAGEPGRAPTLAQVGRLIGLTKERVRQIQNTALEKLRMAFEGAGHGSLAGGAPVAVN